MVVYDDDCEKNMKRNFKIKNLFLYNTRIYFIFYYCL